MNFANYVDDAARETPGRTAVADGARSRSFEELADAADRVAGALETRGVGVGDHVAIRMPNGVPFVVTYLGAMRLGAVPLPVNTRFTDQQIGYVLRDSGAVALVTDDGTDGEPAGTPTYRYPALLDDGERIQDVEPRRSDELAELVYTSGTTGAPKGVYHTHGNLEANARGFVRYKEWTSDDVALTACQCFHVTGLNVTTTPFLALGGTNHLLAEWDVEAALAAVERREVTYTFLIPTMVVDLLESDAVDDYDCGSLEMIGVGGSPMPRRRIREVEETFGCRLLEGYGMTETTPLATFNRPVPGGSRPGSIGRPATEVVEVRIEDPATGEAVPTGERGEFLWRGDTVTPRYNADRITDEKFVERDGERWLQSGDIGWMDEDGFLFVVDRLEDMFTTGCGDIYPREIEEVIYGIDPVENVAIVDTRDEVRGATVTAVLKLRDGGSVSADDVRAVCERELESHEVPDRVEFVDELPRTTTGKLDRVTLRERFR
ncbi:acyl--CoA ligase [Natronomonas salina]|uniref:class I adenylate-forming enzyme family protein n=1 Tax=Natronomonas salina TaxID=1710540 RepID=UPI0015B5AF8B|nr:class I adenylate-forming enzyme family protein [Natronomonas salina]QLD90055.1 acyl--CoA ligase [Natronomonas salina]